MLFVTDSIEGDRRKDSSDRKMRKKQAPTQRSLRKKNNTRKWNRKQ